MKISILPGIVIGKLNSLPFIPKIILKNRYGPQFNYEGMKYKAFNKLVAGRKIETRGKELTLGLTDSKALALFAIYLLEFETK